MHDVTTTIGKADAVLDQRLSGELDKFNGAATTGVAAAEELTVRMDEEGVSGWTWDQAAGIGMEIFRWKSVPTPGRDDVHMRKEL